MRPWVIWVRWRAPLGICSTPVRRCWTEAGAWRWARSQFGLAVINRAPLEAWFEVRPRGEAPVLAW